MQVASVSQTLGRVFFLSAFEDGLLCAANLHKIDEHELRDKFDTLLKQLDELKLDPTEFVLLRNILILKGLFEFGSVLRKFTEIKKMRVLSFFNLKNSFEKMTQIT